MTGYFAVARTCRHLARDHHERAAFFSLYTEAEHWTPPTEWSGASEREWSEPFECRDTDLMEWGGWASKRGARAWLARVERAGLVVVTQKGGPRTPRLVKVANPFPKADRYLDQERDHNSDHNSAGQKPKNGKAGPQPGPQLGPHSVKTRDTERETQSTEGEAPAWQAVWEALKERHPRVRKVPAGLRQVVKDYSVEEALQVLTWAHESQHERAVYLRQKHLRGGCKVLWVGDNFATYLEMSEEPEPVPDAADGKIDVWGIITSKLSTYSPSDPGWRWCEDERLNRAIHAGLYRWEYEGPPALLRVDASWRHKHREAILAAVRTEYRGAS